MQLQLKKNILIPAVILTFLSLITSGLIILFLYYNQNHCIFIYTPAEYTETADFLDNPYRGWYRMYGYSLSDKSPVVLETIQKQLQDSDGCRLALLEINLSDYASSDLSALALAQLEMILSTWEQSPRHLILRFLYDWDGNARQTEPQSESTILRHMDQTAEVVNRHAGTVYLMQGIFVGNYGEMHGSAHLSSETVRTLTQHLADVLDPSVYLSVRTPQHWRTVTQSFDPLTEETAWNGSISARLGLFNDGMLGSASDLNTYSESAENVLPAAKAAADYSVRGSRSEELDFQKNLCSYVPNGGEVVIDNPYNDFQAAVSALADMHVSYLNLSHDADVLKKWEHTSYQGSGCFENMNGLDYIERHLGYRYTITDSSLTYTRHGKDPAVLSVTIANNGFSSCYRPLTAELILHHAETGTDQTLPLDTDTRLWAAGSSTMISIPLDGSNYEPGNYTVYFRLTDPSSGNQIQLANTLTADGTPGCLLATAELISK